MKVVRSTSSMPEEKVTFTKDNINVVFEGSPSGRGPRKLHLVAYDAIVDLETPMNTYAFPASFYDVTYPKVEIVVKP